MRKDKPLYVMSVVFLIYDDYQKAIDRSRCKLHHPQAPIIRPLYSQFITRQEWKGIFLNVAWIVLSVLIVLGVILNYQADRRKA